MPGRQVLHIQKSFLLRVFILIMTYTTFAVDRLVKNVQNLLKRTLHFHNTKSYLSKTLAII